MKRHSMDLSALFLGVAFATISAIVLITDATGANTDPHWVVATISIVLGVVALVVTLARNRRPDTAEAVNPAETAP